MLHRHTLGQLFHRAHMIAVVMRRPHVINLLDASCAQRGEDAIEIAGAGVAGVHEQRFAGRADEQRGLPAFGVDVVDVQRPAGAGLRGHQPRDARESAQ
jgi:hypothetical protein